MKPKVYFLSFLLFDKYGFNGSVNMFRYVDGDIDCATHVKAVEDAILRESEGATAVMLMGFQELHADSPVEGPEVISLLPVQAKGIRRIK